MPVCAAEAFAFSGPLLGRFPLSSPFSPVALVAVPHMPVCAVEEFAFLGPLSGRFPWLRHIRIGIEQILRPLIHF